MKRILTLGLLGIALTTFVGVAKASAKASAQRSDRVSAITLIVILNPLQ